MIEFAASAGPMEWFALAFIGWSTGFLPALYTLIFK